MANVSNEENKESPCLTSAINELKNEQEALEKEKRNAFIKEQTLSEKMEKNFLDYKTHIEGLLKEQVEPEKICEKFTECGVPVDLSRVRNHAQEINDLSQHVPCVFSATTIVMVAAFPLFAFLFFAPAPVVLGAFCVFMIMLMILNP